MRMAGATLWRMRPMICIARIEVPPSWLLPLGALKFAGAVGLIAGIAVPLIGVAAAIGLVLFFACAIFAHLRVGWYSTLAFPIAFLLLSVARFLFAVAPLLFFVLSAL